MKLGLNPFKWHKLAYDFAKKYGRQASVVVQLKADRAEQEKHIMELEKQIQQLQRSLSIANNDLKIAELFHPIPEPRKQRRKYLRQISG